MAVQTTNVSGLAAIRIILSQATTQLFLTGAADLQVLTLCLQQDSTGGRLVTSGNIPGIGDLDETAGADTIYTLVYDAAFNEWAIQAVSNSGDAISSPQIVGSFINTTAPATDFTTAGVSLLSLTEPAGTYRVSINAIVTTTLSGNSVSAAGLTIGYTDANGAETKAEALSAIAAGGNVSAVYTFTSTGAAPITITGTATTGNPTAGVVDVSVVVERIA